MSIKNKSIVSLIGASVAGITTGLILMFEGNILNGYLDPAGIPTKCAGDTNNVIVGKQYTEQECVESLEEQILKHAGPVLECTPQLKGRTFQLSAAISFAYNIGTTAYCNSDAAKRFRANDFVGGCKAINENDQGRLQWVYSKGKILPGLVKRRAAEREICEVGLQV